jgi:hypothetical protein
MLVIILVHKQSVDLALLIHGKFMILIILLLLFIKSRLNSSAGMPTNIHHAHGYGTPFY